MYRIVRDTLEDWYDPNIESALVVLMGSSFTLFLFLNSPDFTNPYYVFGVGVVSFAVVFAALMLITVLLKRR
ncbi:acyl-CoA dehydrogenase [Halorubrum ezzemoulense]|uniref:acyl-CoA dehydrogenase n=1 Tax=Halorubrum ezzemoulense TaxID=337243 RepID=UPI00232CE8DD|nr:acyl-CoA dehydrogenase [Halorubrum ezzemoulense]MDB2253318.1 acyl-CoA dehydrogenase [Halorubrum ezzemoulense]MDB2283620.1 acyl-CoA dehydrogenase [Halorubrum ezzemoulense]